MIFVDFRTNFSMLILHQYAPLVVWKCFLLSFQSSRWEKEVVSFRCHDILLIVLSLVVRLLSFVLPRGTYAVGCERCRSSNLRYQWNFDCHKCFFNVQNKMKVFSLADAKEYAFAEVPSGRAVEKVSRAKDKKKRRWSYIPKYRQTSLLLV